MGNTEPSSNGNRDLESLKGIKSSQYGLPLREVWKMQEVIQSAMIESANEKVKALGKTLPVPWMVQLKKQKQDGGNVMMFQHTYSGPFSVKLMSDFNLLYFFRLNMPIFPNHLQKKRLKILINTLEIL